MEPGAATGQRRRPARQRAGAANGPARPGRVAAATSWDTDSRAGQLDHGVGPAAGPVPRQLGQQQLELVVPRIDPRHVLVGHARRRAGSPPAPGRRLLATAGRRSPSGSNGQRPAAGSTASGFRASRLGLVGPRGHVTAPGDAQVAQLLEQTGRPALLLDADVPPVAGADQQVAGAGDGDVGQPPLLQRRHAPCTPRGTRAAGRAPRPGRSRPSQRSTGSSTRSPRSGNGSVADLLGPVGDRLVGDREHGLRSDRRRPRRPTRGPWPRARSSAARARRRAPRSRPRARAPLLGGVEVGEEGEQARVLAGRARTPQRPRPDGRRRAGRRPAGRRAVMRARRRGPEHAPRP